MVVSRVVDSADGAIRLDQRVLALHHVTIAGFPLALLVAGVAVRHSVVKLVAGVGLKHEKIDFFGPVCFAI